jgi:hypothetical protein
MKTCPFCAEQVQDHAVKCRWCKEFFVSSPVAEVPDPPEAR